jgi:hypothetical protein
MDKQWLNNQINMMLAKKYSQPMTTQERVKGGASALPVIGDAISGYDAYQSAKQGDYMGAALNAVGMLPLVPGLAGTIKKAGDAINPEMMKKLDDYKMAHQAPNPDGNAPLHDLTGGGNIYPDDVYSRNAVQYYGTGDDMLDRQSFSKASMFRGNPDATVEIYRAVPKGVSKDINPGDWVTINRDYAKNHGKSYFDGKYDILKKKVKASDIFTNGDSIHEWGYHPKDIK